MKIEVNLDTSKWYSCTVSQNTLQIKLPGGLEPGDWNVYVKLSVGNQTLGQTGMRSVRFANENIWNTSLGANYLGTFQVTENTNWEKQVDGTFYQSNTDIPPTISNGEMYTINDLVSADNISEAYLVKVDADKKLYLSNDESYLYVTADIPQSASAPVYNLQIKPEASDQTYWLYYQSNGFVYFNHGTPIGCTCTHSGNLVQFRIPLGELMEIYPDSILSSIRVSIQDEADSWINVGEIKSDAFLVSEYFSVYSGTQKVYLRSGDQMTLKPLIEAENISYQWFYENEPILEATQATYTFTANSPGIYSVQMVTDAGTARMIDICEVLDVYETQCRGDINLDGVFSIADVVLMQQYLLKLEKLVQIQADQADMNIDGCVNGFDLVLMRQALLKIELEQNI